MIQRTKISIYRRDPIGADMSIMFCFTYNVFDGIVQNIKWWVDELQKDNALFLNRVKQEMNDIYYFHGNEVKEKELLLALRQKIKQIETDEFNTQQLSNVRRPYRNFVEITKDQIDNILADYIKNMKF